MNTKHRTRTAFSLALVAFFCMGLTAFAQEDMKQIASPAFTVKQRPPAAFPHDPHNEKAKIEDCAACHHAVDAAGKRTASGDSIGTACSECHVAPGAKVPANMAKAAPLERAYHLQCKGCHAKQGKGPVACADCHRPAK